ncbi:hypothetical protein PsSCT_04820 [Pseudomonas sp. SCT]
MARPGIQSKAPEAKAPIINEKRLKQAEPCEQPCSTDYREKQDSPESLVLHHHPNG